MLMEYTWNAAVIHARRRSDFPFDQRPKEMPQSRELQTDETDDLGKKVRDRNQEHEDNGKYHRRMCHCQPGADHHHYVLENTDDTVGHGLRTLIDYQTRARLGRMG